MSQRSLLRQICHFRWPEKICAFVRVSVSNSVDPHQKCTACGSHGSHLAVSSSVMSCASYCGGPRGNSRERRRGAPTCGTVRCGALKTLRHQSFMMLRSRPFAVSTAVACTSALIALRQRVRRPRETAGAVPAAQPQVEEDKANVEYLRHMYAMTRAWYTAAEQRRNCCSP